MLTVYNHRHQQRQCSFCHLALDVPKSLRVNTYDLTLIEACVSGAAGDQSVPREWSVQRPWDGRAAVRSSVLAMPDAPGSAQHASTRQKGVSQPRSTRQRPAPSPLGGKDVRNRGGNLQGHDGPVLREAAPLSPLPPSSCTRSHARQNAAHLKPAPTLAAKYAKRGIAAQHEGPMGRTAPQRQRTAAAEATVQDPHEMPGQRGSCTSGSVAASAVEPEVQELLRAAVRRPARPAAVRGRPRGGAIDAPRARSAAPHPQGGPRGPLAGPSLCRCSFYMLYWHAYRARVMT